MKTKKEIAKMITETLFRNELLNEADACSIEALEKEVQDIILEYLKDFVVINGNILE